MPLLAQFAHLPPNATHQLPVLLVHVHLVRHVLAPVRQVPIDHGSLILQLARKRLVVVLWRGWMDHEHYVNYGGYVDDDDDDAGKINKVTTSPWVGGKAKSRRVSHNKEIRR